MKKFTLFLTNHSNIDVLIRVAKVVKQTELSGARFFSFFAEMTRETLKQIHNQILSKIDMDRIWCSHGTESR